VFALKVKGVLLLASVAVAFVFCYACSQQVQERQVVCVYAKAQGTAVAKGGEPCKQRFSRMVKRENAFCRLPPHYG
jgi:hypothetical protein